MAAQLDRRLTLVRKSLFTLLAAALVVAGGATALATQTVQNDAQAMPQAAVTLTQAITAAEQKAGGRATSAESVHSKAQGWIYGVEVLTGAQVFDIQVDAQTGTVLASWLASRDDVTGHDSEHGGKHSERN